MITHGLQALWSGATHPGRLMRRFLHLGEVARSRRALGRLDAHLLHDIGLTRHEAEVEAARRRWDLPLHWRA